MASRSSSARRKRGGAAFKLAIIMMAVAAISFVYFVRSGSSADKSVIYYTHGRRIRILEVDTTHLDVRPVLAVDRASGESFTSIVDRLKPRAAINGTFYGADMKPLGDVVIDGRLVNRGAYRNAFAVTNAGKIVFLRRARRGKFDWKGYRCALAAGPRLVHNGKIDLDPVADGFSRSSLSIGAWRCGVGTTGSGKMLLVVVTKDVTLSEFAHVMLDIGCVEAMNLDGGGACALYHDGSLLVAPTLPMTNVLAVFERKSGR